MNLSTNAAQTNSEIAMTSLKFLNTIINPAREAFGEPVLENSKFLKKVANELDLSTDDKKSVVENRNKSYYYDLDLDQMQLVGMRESKGVRRQVLVKIKELSDRLKMTPEQQAMATIEMLMGVIKAKETEATDKSIATMTVTDIGKRLGLSAKEVNNTLIQEGLQTRSYSEGLACYHITSEGMPFAVKATSNNCKSSQLRWLPTVLTKLG